MKKSLLKKLILPVLLLVGNIIYGQTVTGIVSEPDGVLPGVSVNVKGTSTGVETDFDGKYTIKAKEGDVLIFSYLGFKTEEKTVGVSNVINVILTEDATSLNEVVVVGYISQTRGDITGSVSSVDVNEALKVPVVNAAEALQGRVSGVTIVNNGTPGAAPRVVIRGFGTVNSTDPLYIIDGVQTDDANILNNLNPADIQQMNVLKDGAAAIYGARASNGVVIITTNGGGYGMDKAKVSLDMYTGFSDIANSPTNLNAEQHAQMLLQSRLNDGLSGAALSHGQYDPTGSGNYTVPSTIQGNRRVVSYNPITYSNPSEFTASVTPGGTNWLDAITRKALTNSVSLSVQNGNENGKYYLSVNYLDRDGVLDYTGYERIGTRLNSEFKVGKRLVIGEHLNVSFSNTNTGADEAIENSFRMTPLLPVRDDQGNFAGVAGTDLGNTRNPLAQLYRARNNYNKRHDITGDVYLSYKLLDELTFKTVLGVGYNTFDSQSFTALDPEHGEPISVNSLNEQDQTFYNWIWTNTLNYKKTFGDHSVNALLGFESLKDEGNGRGITNTDYLFETPDFYTIFNGQGAPSIDYAFAGGNSLWSVFGTVNYSYKGNYFLTATLRRDTTSRFRGDNQSGVFPSFTAGWIVSNEDFWNSDSFVNRLKIKGSWGELGNQSLPVGNPTINQNRLSPSLANYAFNGNAGSIVTGALLSDIGNPNLKWETSENFNVGFEADFLDSKFNLSWEYYIIKTNDFIVQDLFQNPTTGIDANAPYVNLGSAKNTGFDLSASYGDQVSEDFSFNVSANLSHYKNEITSLVNDVATPGRGDLRNGAVTRTEVGEEMSYFYGRKVTGLDNNGRMVFEDVNGDGVVDDSDKTKIGSPHPDFVYGININLKYKGFDAQVFFNGSQGNDLYNYNKVFTDFGLFFNGNRNTRVLNAWTPSNTNTNVPALSAAYPLEEVSSNSYFVEDGSFFRLKNLQIGYTIPNSLTSKAGIETVRLYLQGSNLFTITDYTGFDPEVSAGSNLSLGIDSRLYPISKVFSFGMNIKF
jgi:TonB-linked SusC/RagA family outer membrane protein